MRDMARIEVSGEYLVQVLQDLIETPSPAGDTEWAISFVQNELESLGLRSSLTTKGALVARYEGLRDDAPRALTAHVDTLGAMVAEIKSSGRLRLAPIGGVMWPTVESEGVTIATQRGDRIRGSLVLANGSAHVSKTAHEARRDAESLEVRLDERTRSAEETRLLGVEVGDYVSFDPRFERAASGFIRSRFLDDKACVACVLAAVKALADMGISPAQRTDIVISNLEENGFGCTDAFPSDLQELLVLDMACVGQGQNGDEYHCSICLKDGAGPYHKGFSDRLRNIAGRSGLDLKPDLYRYYSSDGSAYLRAGGAARVALIGPGVDTSHGYERTHMDALIDTSSLIASYLIEENA